MTKKSERDEESKRKDAELQERIAAYRNKIHECIYMKKMFELEQVLNELTLARDDMPDSLKIYKELRMNIIHGQICLASFFKWKRDVKDRQVNVATETFK